MKVIHHYSEPFEQSLQARAAKSMCKSEFERGNPAGMAGEPEQCTWGLVKRCFWRYSYLPSLFSGRINMFACRTTTCNSIIFFGTGWFITIIRYTLYIFAFRKVRHDILDILISHHIHMLVTYTSLHFRCWCTISLSHFCPGVAGHARWCKGQGLEGLLQWGWCFRNSGHGWGVEKQQCPPNILYLLNIDGWKLIHFLSKWSLFRGEKTRSISGV